MTQQQIEQMRVSSIRQGLTMYGEYVAGAMDASEWQRKHDIDKACEVYRKELSEIISLLNEFGKKLYGINKLGELIHLEGSVKDFRKAMEGEQC